MDNSKTGDLIRETRKERGLTQKDIAEKLGITDRAVSKWERGICAPDISLLESLSDLLGITIAELISGERKPPEPYTEACETVIKETICYSQNELISKKRTVSKRLWVVSLLAVLLSIAILFGVLWYKGFFCITGRYVSPDRKTVTTVYDRRLGYGDPPSSGGFTLSDKGRFNGRTIYENATFRGLWWSANSGYQVVSMVLDGKTWLSMADYTRNLGVNLTSRLENAIYNNRLFDDVPYDADGRKLISFDFCQWSNADPEKMLIIFHYTNRDNALQEGYMWFDYESGKISGEMKIEQGEKASNPLNDLLLP